MRALRKARSAPSRVYVALLPPYATAARTGGTRDTYTRVRAHQKPRILPTPCRTRVHWQRTSTRPTRRAEREIKANLHHRAMSCQAVERIKVAHCSRVEHVIVWQHSAPTAWPLVFVCVRCTVCTRGAPGHYSRSTPRCRLGGVGRRLLHINCPGTHALCHGVAQLTPRVHALADSVHVTVGRVGI